MAGGTEAQPRRSGAAGPGRGRLRAAREESRGGPAIAATIAGSDSGGGAGIQADVKAFAAHRVHGVTVVVAVTAQNTLGVSAVHAVPLPVVREQFRALDADLRPAAVKTGMLLSAEAIELVSELLAGTDWGPLVVDPVMIAKGGARLLEPSAVDAMRESLLPLAEVLTPNWPEAEVLSGLQVASAQESIAAGARLLQMGPRWVLVKGGHSPSEATDYLIGPTGVTPLEGRRVFSRNTHGTGCTLSAAITAGLARGLDVPRSAAAAKRYLQAAIEAAPGIGAGHGPLQHFPFGWPRPGPAGSELPERLG